MKTFVIKIALFGLIVTALLVTILKCYGGYADYFYQKFTTPRQKSLILGDSRVFQGIQPSVLNSNLSGFDLPVYNFGFMLTQMAYGDCYLEAVKNKLDPSTKNGLFILQVNPWILSERPGDDVKHGVFFESDLPPHNMRLVTADPNPEYFFRNFSLFHFRAIFRKVSCVHKDGWLELNVAPMDSAAVVRLRHEEFQRYAKLCDNFRPSDYRVRKLEETIKFLQGHGTVVLLRMPGGRSIVNLENSFWNGFDKQMEVLGQTYGIRYINYSKSDLTYESFDQVHLTNESGRQFTKTLADSIMNLKSLTKSKK